MGLLSEGIERVRAFELPAGIRRDGEYVAEVRAAVVRWSASAELADKLYQVYVNGRYAGATVDCEQRELVVALPDCTNGPVCIEVFAVDAEQAHIDFSQELDPAVGRSGRVRLKLLRGQNLPLGSVVEIFCDKGTGQVDYSERIGEPVEVWACWQDKAGFGIGGFGVGDFGYDSSAAVGFGKGSFGIGHFGLDADAIEWVSEPLEPGVYRFGVRVVDEAGRISSASETGQVMVDRAARPRKGLGVYSFDREANRLILSVGESV